MALRAALVEHDDLAGLDVTDILRADDVERAGFRGQDRAAAEFAQYQGADAERIARPDQLLVGQRYQRIGALDRAERLDEAIDEAVALRLRDQMQDDFGVGGGLHHGAVAHKVPAQRQPVGEIAVVANRETAGIEFGEQRLHVAQDGGAGGRVADMADRGIAGQAVDDLAAGEGVADEAEPPLGMKSAPVEGDDARSLLAAMLQGVQSERGAQSHKPFPPKPPRPCIFEYIYFSRPDSIVGGRSVYEVRKAFGAQLARESHVEVDVVVPVPDSGVPAAVGYSQHSGVPFELGIIRNHYVGRTFIQPIQSVRELGVRMKHNANRAAIEGKRIILIDDSLVRGTTSKKIVRMMRDAGAREVHFRLASPPIIHPDYYGIDLPDRGGLLAATHNLEEMREIIGADSLAFLSIDGMYRAMGEPGRDPANPKFADHCFTGAYPTHLTDQAQVEPQPRQLSLLAEAS